VKKLSEQLKNLRDNTDRRFAITMTAISDLMAAIQAERNQTTALLDIQTKVTKPKPPTPPKPKTQKKKE